jgi:hypothetical protein
MTMTSNYIPYATIVYKTHLSPTKLPRSDVLSTFAVGMAWVTSTEDIELVFDIDAGSKRLFRIKTKDAEYGEAAEARRDEWQNSFSASTRRFTRWSPSPHPSRTRTVC